MKNLTLLLIACTLVFVSPSCKKEGPPGPAGKDGNANVISSNTVVLNNWISLYDDGTEFTYSSTITWSSITQDIRDRGMVMAYMKDNSSSQWTALPYSTAGDGYTDAFNFDFNTGIVNIIYDGYDNFFGSPGASSVNGVFTVRLVAVPASIRVANPDIDWNDYSQVRKLLHE